MQMQSVLKITILFAILLR